MFPVPRAITGGVNRIPLPADLEDTFVKQVVFGCIFQEPDGRPRAKAETQLRLRGPRDPPEALLAPQLSGRMAQAEPGAGESWDHLVGQISILLPSWRFWVVSHMPQEPGLQFPNHKSKPNN